MTQYGLKQTGDPNWYSIFEFDYDLSRNVEKVFPGAGSEYGSDEAGRFRDKSGRCLTLISGEAGFLRLLSRLNLSIRATSSNSP